MKLYGLIGYPLGHSFSKEYFTRKFEKESLADCFFELFPLIKIDQFNHLIQSQLSLKGLCVTIPYKQSVIPFLHSISDEAKNIGAVNCIQMLPGGLKGHNTDVVGFEQSFIPHLKPHHNKALVLGTGGASKAVQFVLNKLSIPFLIVSRVPAGNQCIGYNKIDKELLEEYTVIINCTPLGMYPNEDALPPLPYQNLSSQHYLYDLIYKPAETKFLQQGKQTGATIKNGYDMLIIQAEENWRIWNGIVNGQ